MSKQRSDQDRLLAGNIHVLRAKALLQALQLLLNSGSGGRDVLEFVDAQSAAALDQLTAAEKELYL